MPDAAPISAKDAHGLCVVLAAFDASKINQFLSCVCRKITIICVGIFSHELGGGGFIYPKAGCHRWLDYSESSEYLAIAVSVRDNPAAHLEVDTSLFVLDSI